MLRHCTVGTYTYGEQLNVRITNFSSVKFVRKCLHQKPVSNYRVATCQGKVREKQNFLQVRELSGNFEKMSGNFGHLTNVREMSGNFVMTIKFFQK